MFGGIAAYPPIQFIASDLKVMAIGLQETLDRRLALASKKGDIERVRDLIDLGADPSARQSLALMDAAENNDTDIIRLLLENGAKADDSSSMALYQATIISHHKKSPANTANTVRLLLEEGADPNTLEGDMALNRAIDDEDIQTAIVLLEYKGKTAKNNAEEEKLQYYCYGKVLKEFKVEVCETLVESKMRFNQILGDIRLNKSHSRSLQSFCVRTINQFFFEHGYSSGDYLLAMKKLSIPPSLKDLLTAPETHYHLPFHLNPNTV